MRQKLLLYTFLLLWGSIFSQSDSIAKDIESVNLQPTFINEEITELKSSEFYTVKKIELEGTNRNKRLQTRTGACSKQ